MGEAKLCAVTFAVLLLCVAAFGVFAYLALFFTHVPGAQEERLGELAPLPERLGEWISETRPNAEGLLREERHLLRAPTGFGRQVLLHQVRFRDPVTREIVRVEPEREVPRQRLRKGR